MILVAAVDDRYGLMFNKRRQSKDVKLREHLLALCNGRELRMNDYTFGQFTEAELADHKIYVGDDFLDSATEDSICFVENRSVLAYEDKVDKIWIYKWNRKYPSDVSFDIPLMEHKWNCTICEEFVGNSHEKITLEEWTR